MKHHIIVIDDPVSEHPIDSEYIEQWYARASKGLGVDIHVYECGEELTAYIQSLAEKEQYFKAYKPVVVDNSILTDEMKEHLKNDGPGSFMPVKMIRGEGIYDPPLLLDLGTPVNEVSSGTISGKSTPALKKVEEIMQRTVDGLKADADEDQLIWENPDIRDNE